MPPDSPRQLVLEVFASIMGNRIFNFVSLDIECVHTFVCKMYQMMIWGFLKMVVPNNYWFSY